MLTADMNQWKESFNLTCSLRLCTNKWEENSNLQLEFVFNIFVNLCDFTLWDPISLHDDNKKLINTTEQSHHFNINELWHANLMGYFQTQKLSQNKEKLNSK